jgi:hypothetical protein
VIVKVPSFSDRRIDEWPVRVQIVSREFMVEVVIDHWNSGGLSHYLLKSPRKKSPKETQ